jgi:hypothetical protein
MNYRDFAKDLRALADLLDATATDLPLPQYDIPLDITIHVTEAQDVFDAALALGVEANVTDSGHSTATRHVDSVDLRFLHITADAMVKYNARAEYARTMPVSR